MNIKKVSLREMMEDDSEYMSELVKKFEDMYGKELEKIIAESKKSESAVFNRMALNNRSTRRSRSNSL
jgi:predicted component of viral defense system (DUF524 family)